jgi:hypothetical protein
MAGNDTEGPGSGVRAGRHERGKGGEGGRTRVRGGAGTHEVCPRCGRPAARVIGRAEAFSVLYLQCGDCGQTSVAPA